MSVNFQAIYQNLKKSMKKNFNTFLNLAFDLLSQEKKIYLKDKNGIYEFSLFKNEFIGDFLLPCDIKAINSVFVCSNEKFKTSCKFRKTFDEAKA